MDKRYCNLHNSSGFYCKMDNSNRFEIVKSTVKWIMGTVKIIFRKEVMVKWIVGNSKNSDYIIQLTLQAEQIKG